jgi:hypothetical protein
MYIYFVYIFYEYLLSHCLALLFNKQIKNSIDPSDRIVIWFFDFTVWMNVHSDLMSWPFVVVCINFSLKIFSRTVCARGEQIAIL